jgi:hypothetical protein
VEIERRNVGSVGLREIHNSAFWTTHPPPDEALGFIIKLTGEEGKAWRHPWLSEFCPHRKHTELAQWDGSYLMKEPLRTMDLKEWSNGSGWRTTVRMEAQLNVITRPVKKKRAVIIR